MKKFGILSYRVLGSSACLSVCMYLNIIGLMYIVINFRDSNVLVHTQILMKLTGH